MVLSSAYLTIKLLIKNQVPHTWEFTKTTLLLAEYPYLLHKAYGSYEEECQICYWWGLSRSRTHCCSNVAPWYDPAVKSSKYKWQPFWYMTMISSCCRVEW
jgi:hypothetical protein